MLYIHRLFQLNPKSADIESVQIIRDIKDKTPYPITEKALQDYLTALYVSQTDSKHMKDGLELLNEVTQDFTVLYHNKDPVHEHVNLERSIKLLKGIPEALKKNLDYADMMIEYQQFLASEMSNLLNGIPSLKKDEERNFYNQKLNKIFERILKSKDFTFNSQDMVNEAHKEIMTSLMESMDRGFIFRFTLEDEVKKKDFSQIKDRIPPQMLKNHAELAGKIGKVKLAVDRAYDVNMRMINMAVIIYSYVKWLSSR